MGFPGGKVCTEQQVPGYVQAVSVCVRRGDDPHNSQLERPQLQRQTSRREAPAADSCWSSAQPLGFVCIAPYVLHTYVYTHSQASTLKAAGVDKVVCVTVGDPKEVQQWVASNGFDKAALVSSCAYVVELTDVSRTDWCCFVLLMWVVCLKQLPCWPDPLTHPRVVLAPAVLSCPALSCPTAAAGAG